MGIEEPEKDLIERAAQRLKEQTLQKPVEDARAEPPHQDAVMTKPDASASVSALEPPKVPDTPKVEVDDRDRRSRYADIDLNYLRRGGFIVPDDAPTRVAEEFRIIKRQVLRRAQKSSPDRIENGNLILVSSTQPGEGKTFCALNLALSVASERDHTVLLVDADVARPQLLSAMGLEADKGLIDVIVDDRVDISDCLLRTNIENLTILPAGRPHPGSTELLASERTSALIQELSQRYDDRIVIFDSSPVLASSAPGVLAQRLGQIVFVVEADRTRESQLVEALTLVSECRHINLVLNKSRFMGGKVRFGSYYEYYQS
ncbi:MAG: XrtA-associated tyrosine autokinase [Alphaproteobacteria bacterium]